MESILLIASLSLGQTFEVKPGFIIAQGKTVEAKADDITLILRSVRPYRPTRFAQRVATTNGAPSLTVYAHTQDDHWQNSEPALNPNRLFPWSVPGGLHASKGWKSEVGYSFPDGAKIKVWSEIVPRARAPRVRWAFPDGSKFTDALYSESGELFELRLREKVNGKWKSSVPFRDLSKAPRFYQGPGKACADCHSKAGDSLQYGILLRGDDENFSFPVLKEGTTRADPALPLEQARRAADNTPPALSFPPVSAPPRFYSAPVNC